jgi:hypothetical protein
MGLSFLDVLCCGLGSAVLLFLIVKHGGTVQAQSTNQGAFAAPIAAQIATEARLREEIDATERDFTEVAQALEQAQNALRSREATVATNQGLTGRYLDEIKKLGAERSRNEVLARELEARRAAAAVAAAPTPTPKVAPTKPTSPRGAVEGINVADADRVVVLLDVSASMLHRSLVEIVRLRASSFANQRRAAKWVQATNTLRWAYQSISEGQRYKLLTFSEAVTDLSYGSTVNGKLTWMVKGGPDEDPATLMAQVAAIKPERGTDLSKALEAVTSLAPRPSKLLLITDGLPNHMRATGLRKSPTTVKSCLSRKPVTTGDCRGLLAIDTLNYFSSKLTGTSIDIVLLPLDGDSEALRFYGLVTGSTGGRLLAPSADWLL